MLQRHADTPVSLELCVICRSDGGNMVMELVQQCPVDKHRFRPVETVAEMGC